MNEPLFRCSQLVAIMPTHANEIKELSETAKQFLSDKFISERYGRDTDVIDKYIRKSLNVQDEATKLYCNVKKQLFKRNEFTLSNRYISGTPDLFTGDLIHQADLIVDVKSSWDIFTFFRNSQAKLNKAYYWQLHGYMALTGAKMAKLVYCLVDTPQPLLYDELSRLKWKMGVINPETDENYHSACKELERLAKYDDVPMHERVTEIEIDRNDADIERIYERVKECRKWMNENLFKTLHSANVG